MTEVTVRRTSLGQTAGIDTPEQEISEELPRRAPSRRDRLSRRVSRPLRSLQGVPHVGTWSGLLLVTLGLVLLVVAWGEVAGLTAVSLQLPYLLSAGLPGLALVAIGLTVVNISAKQADSRARMEQTDELRELLAELRRAVIDGERS